MAQNLAVAERLNFMGLDSKARGSIRALAPMIRSEIKTALDRFYDRVRSDPQARAFFRDEAQISGASRRQQEHWERLIGGEYDDAYAARTRAVGATHARLGLEPRWYIGGYALIAEHLVKAAVKNAWPKGMFAGKPAVGEQTGQMVADLIKTVMLDMELGVTAYADALDEARQREEAARKAADDERARLVEALGQALGLLAQGDLGARLWTEVSPDYQRLKDDYNAAVASLGETVGGVEHATRGITRGADEIAHALTDLSRRTESTAASLEETAAALEEVTATVRRTASAAREASDVVGAAKSEAETSGVVVRDAVAAMGQIEQSSSRIGNIIGVIDEIAFQTNLLALNAGVEAARAGEAGRGFAVVASEVRALAQRSADAAKEIKELISQSGRQVSDGVSLVGQTGEALQRIVDRVVQIDGLVTEIAASAQEQATGLAQVNTAVGQMDHVTQQNAAMVERSTTSSRNLKIETVELANLIGRFSTRQTYDAAPGRIASTGEAALPAPEPRMARLPAASRPALAGPSHAGLTLAQPGVHEPGRNPVAEQRARLAAFSRPGY